VASGGSGATKILTIASDNVARRAPMSTRPHEGVEGPFVLWKVSLAATFNVFYTIFKQYSLLLFSISAMANPKKDSKVCTQLSY